MFFSLKKQLGNFEIFYTVYYCICRLCDKLMLKCFDHRYCFIEDNLGQGRCQFDVSLCLAVTLLSEQCIMISTSFQHHYKGNELLLSPS